MQPVDKRTLLLGGLGVLGTVVIGGGIRCRFSLRLALQLSLASTPALPLVATTRPTTPLPSACPRSRYLGGRYIDPTEQRQLSEVAAELGVGTLQGPGGGAQHTLAPLPLFAGAAAAAVLMPLQRALCAPLCPAANSTAARHLPPPNQFSYQTAPSWRF